MRRTIALGIVASCLTVALGAAVAVVAVAQQPAAALPARLPGDPPRDAMATETATRQSVDVLYAQTIVLRGSDGHLVLDASGRAPGLGGRPGIILTSAQTGQSATIFLDASGRAVVGVSAPGRTNFPVALFLGRDGGVVQVEDQHRTHVFRASDLARKLSGAVPRTSPTPTLPRSTGPCDTGLCPY